VFEALHPDWVWVSFLLLSNRQTRACMSAVGIISTEVMFFSFSLSLKLFNVYRFQLNQIASFIHHIYKDQELLNQNPQIPHLSRLFTFFCFGRNLRQNKLFWGALSCMVGRYESENTDIV
jgi:hypothetical protein